MNMRPRQNGGNNYSDTDNPPANDTLGDVLVQPDIHSLPLVHQGKVRNVYDAGDNRLLIVATDRLSAFDVVLPDPIPGKGRLLTEMSCFWFEYSTRIIPNHLLPIAPEEVLTKDEATPAVCSRSMVVVKTKPLPIEAIVRGHLAGSGWLEYQQTGAVCGEKLPPDLHQGQQLPKSIFTPSTKAAAGDHDANISFQACVEMIGQERADQVRDMSLSLYDECASHAKARGIVIADTKFEFGVDNDGRLLLIDEVLTPDSSRFWPLEEWARAWHMGQPVPSFDKQFVRDHLDKIGWDRKPPAPRLPREIIVETAEKYRHAQALLTRPEPLAQYKPGR